MNDLSCGKNVRGTFFRFVTIHTRLTDRRTDSQLSPGYTARCITCTVKTESCMFHKSFSL